MYRPHFAESAFDVVDKLNQNLRDIEAEFTRRPIATPEKKKSAGVAVPIPSPSAIRHDETAGIDEGDIRHLTSAWVTGLTGGGSTTLHSHSQYMLAAMRGAVNGVCELDANSLIPIGRVPASLLGGVRYQGVWNATTNSPTLATSPDSTTKGFYYKVSVAGTWNSVSWEIGDWIISNGTSWDKIDNTDAVTSVAGRTGAVVLTKSDVGLANVDNTSDVNKPISTATQTALNGKAPTAHNSTATTYGVGSSTDYGHVQIEDVVTNGSTKAVTSNAVYDAIIANKFVNQNTGTFGNGVLVGSKGGFAGLSAAGQKRIVFLSDSANTACGMYNETDGKWLVKFDGQTGLVTDYTPTAPDINTNLLVNSGWVLSRLADTTVGNADKVDGYHIVYTTYAGKGSASNTFYFTAG